VVLQEALVCVVQGAHATWPTSTSFTFQGTFFKKLPFPFHFMFVFLLYVLVCCLTFCLFICCGLLLSIYGFKKIKWNI